MCLALAFELTADLPKLLERRVTLAAEAIALIAQAVDVGACGIELRVDSVDRVGLAATCGFRGSLRLGLRGGGGGFRWPRHARGGRSVVALRHVRLCRLRLRGRISFRRFAGGRTLEAGLLPRLHLRRRQLYVDSGRHVQRRRLELERVALPRERGD